MPFDFGSFESELGKRLQEYTGDPHFVEITLMAELDVYEIYTINLITDLPMRHMIAGSSLSSAPQRVFVLEEILKSYAKVPEPPKGVDHCIEVLSKALNVT